MRAILSKTRTHLRAAGLRVMPSLLLDTRTQSTIAVVPAKGARGATRRTRERRAGTHNHRKLLDEGRRDNYLAQRLPPVVMGPRLPGCVKTIVVSQLERRVD